MLTVEELVICSLYHRLVLVNVRRDPSPATEQQGSSHAQQAERTDRERCSEVDDHPPHTSVDPPRKPATNTPKTAAQGLGFLMMGAMSPALKRAFGVSRTAVPGVLPALQQAAAPDSNLLHQMLLQQEGVHVTRNVQTILDTGQLQLVRTILKTSETQTETLPMWCFGPRGESSPVQGSSVAGDGEEENVMSLISKSVSPAVDLANCDSFSIVRLEDLRDPSSKSLVMVQTNEGVASITDHQTDSLLYEAQAALSATALGEGAMVDFGGAGDATLSTIHSCPDPTVSTDKMAIFVRDKSLTEESTGGGHDHEIDSGIWDMVQGLESKQSTRESTPLALQAGKVSRVGGKRLNTDMDEEEQEEYYDTLTEPPPTKMTGTYKVFNVNEVEASSPDVASTSSIAHHEVKDPARSVPNAEVKFTIETSESESGSHRSSISDICYQIHSSLSSSPTKAFSGLSSPRGALSGECSPSSESPSRFQPAPHNFPARTTNVGELSLVNHVREDIIIENGDETADVVATGHYSQGASKPVGDVHDQATTTPGKNSTQGVRKLYSSNHAKPSTVNFLPDENDAPPVPPPRRRRRSRQPPTTEQLLVEPNPTVLVSQPSVDQEGHSTARLVTSTPVNDGPQSCSVSPSSSMFSYTTALSEQASPQTEFPPGEPQSPFSYRYSAVPSAGDSGISAVLRPPSQRHITYRDSAGSDIPSLSSSQDMTDASYADSDGDEASVYDFELPRDVAQFERFPEWMSNLPVCLQNAPLTQLAIPGSHMSLAIDRDLRPDMEFSKCNYEMAEFMRKLPNLSIFNNFRGLMKNIWRAWMPKQMLGVYHQLDAGVRYLDLHVTKYRNAFYGEHGLYTRQLKHYLKQVRRFLDEHAREVVIMHFPDLDQLNRGDKRRLVTMLFQMFGARLARATTPGETTLAYLWKHDKQVIVVLPEREMELLRNHIFVGLVWSDENVLVPRANTHNVDELVQYLSLQHLEDVCTEMGRDKLHVTRAVLSPDMTMVFGDFQYKSMRELSWQETTPAVSDWLIGVNKLNVVVMDFVGMGNIISTILRINDASVGKTETAV